MAIKLVESGVQECLGQVSTGINELAEAAAAIDTAMGNLGEYWEGAAYEKTITTYGDEYQKLLTVTVPEAVESLRAYIQKCEETILEVDAQLAGF